MTFSGMTSLQDEKELAQFIELVKREKVTSYLEIGCACGDTFHAVVSSMPKGSFAVAIDDPTGTWGLPDSQKYLLEAVADLKRKGYDAHAFFGDSKGKAVIEKAEMFAPYDLILIDGDHSYDGVSADFNNYGKLGRIVALHDIAYPSDPPTKKQRIQVREFWDLIKKIGKTEEFVTDGANKGIGVIY